MASVCDQREAAPYLDAVVAYARRRPVRFHVPGHRGGAAADAGTVAALGIGALECDVPLDVAGVSLGADSPLAAAEALAAEAHGAARTWFLTNGATQGNHAVCLALTYDDAPVVVQRNVHASVLDGLVLSGAAPSWVRPAFDAEHDIHHVVSPRALAGALHAQPAARAAMIVSPTYFGAVADVAGLAAAAHAAGASLVVDQSWGAHFGFAAEVPACALAHGADVVITSTHKLGGSLTQSAMLHLGRHARADEQELDRWVRLTRSTSPSGLLMLSLDGARRQLSLDGAQLLREAADIAAGVRAAVAELPGCRIVGHGTDVEGVAAWDPLRVIVNVSGTGRSGHEVAALLVERHDIHLELATPTCVLALIGMRTSRFDARALVAALAELGVAPAPERAGVVSPAALPALPAPEMAMTPRAAFRAPARSVPVAEAAGEVAAEVLAPYPPGIPVVVPGERLTPAALGYLVAARARRARVHGAGDPELRTVRCVAVGPGRAA